MAILHDIVIIVEFHVIKFMNILIIALNYTKFLFLMSSIRNDSCYGVLISY